MPPNLSPHALSPPSPLKIHHAQIHLLSHFLVPFPQPQISKTINPRNHQHIHKQHTTCSTKCLTEAPHPHRPTPSFPYFRLHSPPFLSQTLPLLRLPNRRSRLRFDPDRRRPTSDELHPTAL